MRPPNAPAPDSTAAAAPGGRTRASRPAQLRRRGTVLHRISPCPAPPAFCRLPTGADTPAVDTLILPYAQRQAQKGFLFGVKGTCVELDLAEPVRLRTDDALVLDDGRLVEVVAEPEPLIEVRAADLPALARLAWHLGDRHVPVQVLERRLRLKRDPAIETLLQSLGAKVVAIEAPFEPEGGAYAARRGRA